MRVHLSYPPATRGVIVVWSLIASLPIPGTTWHRLQYLAGLRRLGFDVWYVEELDRWLNRPGDYKRTTRYDANLRYLRRVMELIGFEDRWIFRPPGNEQLCFGARNLDGLMRLYEKADLVINHTGAQWLKPWHSKIRALAYLETDPVANQIGIAKGDQTLISELSRYDYLLTFGANLGATDCKVPVERLHWIPTRPAICIDWWDCGCPVRIPLTLTTITAWERSSRRKDLVWQDDTWRWSKCDGFRHCIDLPKNAALSLELTIKGATDLELESFRQRGWRVRPATDLATPAAYRHYIMASAGEFTVAKEQYVASRVGWFSERSACYLAAGRPVISEETGFSNSLPTGTGLFAFSDQTEALEAIRAVALDYQRQSHVAREIAHGFFSADRVIGDSLRAIGLL